MYDTSHAHALAAILAMPSLRHLDLVIDKRESTELTDCLQKMIAPKTIAKGTKINGGTILRAVSEIAGL